MNLYLVAMNEYSSLYTLTKLFDRITIVIVYLGSNIFSDSKRPGSSNPGFGWMLKAERVLKRYF